MSSDPSASAAAPAASPVHTDARPAPALFAPMALRGLALPNRIVVSPMCQYSAIDGHANAWHAVHLGGLALSGAGMVILEATAVAPEGRITPGCLGLWDDETAGSMASMLGTVREAAERGLASDAPPPRLAVQIAHAGRKGSSAAPWNGGGLLAPADGGWPTVAPSALPHRADEVAPRALRADEVAALPDAFAAAARRAVAAGLDAIELHAAHGYLLHQFLSPLSNRRDDDWGGSLANRMRLALDCFDAMRAAWPADRPLGVRISATDWVDGGWDLESSIVLSRELAARGCDWIDVSTAGVSPAQKIPVGPGFQVPYAEAIRQALQADAAAGGPAAPAVMAVGLITEPAQAEAIVADGRADLVALGRTMMYDPRWTWRAAAELGGTVHAPRPWWRAPERRHAGIFGATRFGQR